MDGVFAFLSAWAASAHEALVFTGVSIALAAGAFAGLFAGLRGPRRALREARTALPESRLNLALAGFNAAAVAPVLAFLATGLHALFQAAPGHAALSQFWSAAPVWTSLAAAIVAGDLTGYWRHRLEHHRFIWPSHAVHHSDQVMTWLTLFRFHPVNRATTYLIDGAVLALLGFPAEAVLANALVRQYYGMVIHARLDWDYGPLKRVFVSPVMHRWHHAADAVDLATVFDRHDRPTTAVAGVTTNGGQPVGVLGRAFVAADRRAFNANYATVFSIWDQAFGTYFAPGGAPERTGVDHPMAPGLAGQLAHPLHAKAYRRSHAANAAPGEFS